jgi:hypothetical protein
MSDEIQIRLGADEALVLFELLCRFDETENMDATAGQVAFEDAAEPWALVLLHGALERVIGASAFDPHYSATVQAARARIRQRAGLE